MQSEEERAGFSARIRAAEYVRMSTEHQKYSTENQSDKIREYAEQHKLLIVRTYADQGKSGLRIDGRQALQQLIKDVESGSADYQIILVYDVSRWGRFQDADESAYYEYICKRAGLQVVYCAEQFENDGSPVSTIVKGVKRAMAGEYSRELSAKVFAGQCRLIELGYRQGGSAGYGLRRVLIDQAGSLKGELARGEHKSIQTDRVILTERMITNIGGTVERGRGTSPICPHACAGNFIICICLKIFTAVKRLAGKCMGKKVAIWLQVYCSAL
jgi:DNA invertase Pin-like site-specific DNA recombinase